MLIESYLEKPYWVIDILPKQVPENSRGQYFAIERHYSEHPRIDAIYQRFADILLKLNCYEDFDVSSDGEQWLRNPEPKVLEAMVSKCMFQLNMLYIFLPAADAMVIISGDDTNMTVYNPSDTTLELLNSLVSSEGLFIWKP